MSDQLKEAFSKVKQDISSLKQELEMLKIQLYDLTNKLDNLIQQPESSQQIPTHNQEFQTTPTHNPTHPQEIRGLISPNLRVSIGNEGVPTDRQTNQQTDQHIIQQMENEPKRDFEQATKILESLDNIKKEIRLKFKRLTSQEMLVFSTLYQLEQEQQDVSYKDLAARLKLSQSSIRDYISKLITKGVPVDKLKQNNKQIFLKISEDLKKIASLGTILKLRGL